MHDVCDVGLTGIKPIIKVARTCGVGQRESSDPLVFGNQGFEVRRRGLERREKGKMAMERIDDDRWRIGRWRGVACGRHVSHG